VLGSDISRCAPPGITMEVENVSEENDLPVDRGICAFMSTLKRVSQHEPALPFAAERGTW